MDDALIDASTAIACDKNHFKAYRRRADVNMALHKHENALADYEMVMTMLQRQEPNADVLNNIKHTRRKLAKLNKIIKEPYSGKIYHITHQFCCIIKFYLFS